MAVAKTRSQKTRARAAQAAATTKAPAPPFIQINVTILALDEHNAPAPIGQFQSVNTADGTAADHVIAEMNALNAQLALATSNLVTAEQAEPTGDTP